jgi:hypothetical protein
MATERAPFIDGRVEEALQELQARIRQQYPSVLFRVGVGEDDPEIVQLVAIVDVDDTDPVLDVVIDRVLDLQEHGLPIFVVTERPNERTAALREAMRGARPDAVPATPS